MRTSITHFIAFLGLITSALSLPSLSLPDVPNPASPPITNTSAKSGTPIADFLFQGLQEAQQTHPDFVIVGYQITLRDLDNNYWLSSTVRRTPVYATANGASPDALNTTTMTTWIYNGSGSNNGNGITWAAPTQANLPFAMHYTMLDFSTMVVGPDEAYNLVMDPKLLAQWGLAGWDGIGSINLARQQDGTMQIYHTFSGSGPNRDKRIVGYVGSMDGTVQVSAVGGTS